MKISLKVFCYASFASILTFSCMPRPHFRITSRERLRSIMTSMTVCVCDCVSVCLSACLRGYLRSHTRDLYQIFCVCCLWPWRRAVGEHSTVQQWDALPFNSSVYECLSV